MELTDSLLKTLAERAHLDVTDQEPGNLREELQRLLTHVEKINELDLSKVEPLEPGEIKKDTGREDRMTSADRSRNERDTNLLPDERPLPVPRPGLSYQDTNRDSED